MTAPADSASPPGLDFLLPRALSHRFEFVSEQRQIERYRLERRAAGRLRYPEPTVVLGMKRGDVAKGETETSSAVITIPLPDFNKGQTEVAPWSAEMEASIARSDGIERRIRAEVAGAAEAVRLRMGAIEQYRREVSALGDDLEPHCTGGI